MGRSFHLSAALHKIFLGKTSLINQFPKRDIANTAMLLFTESHIPTAGNTEDQIRNQQKPVWSNISSHLSNICTFTAALTAKLLIFI